jgi:hypothetical protein
MDLDLINLDGLQQTPQGAKVRSNRKAMTLVLGSHWMPSSLGSLPAPGVKNGCHAGKNTEG